MSTIFDDLQQGTKISFKSDVAAEHVCGQNSTRNQSQKATRRCPQERK